MFIDSHCHLDRLLYSSSHADLDDALDTARSRGVDAFLSIGVDLESSKNLISLARQYPDIYVSVGIHPLQDVLPELASSMDVLLSMANQKRVVAIGETGLDYHYAADTKVWQRESFIIHLEAARRAHKPVVVHSRAAKEDTLAMLAEYACKTSSGVVHCFTEDWAMAKAVLDLGFYLSFSGIITFRNAGDLREIVKKAPLDRILVETDAPWLAPVPYRGKPNFPGYVIEVAQQVAELKGLGLDELGAITTDNFRRLFFMEGQ